MGLGLVLHEADQILDTGGIPLDDIVAIALLLFFGIRTLQVMPRLLAQRAPRALLLFEIRGDCCEQRPRGGQIPKTGVTRMLRCRDDKLRCLSQEAGDADDKAKEEEEEAQETVTAFNGGPLLLNRAPP